MAHATWFSTDRDLAAQIDLNHVRAVVALGERTMGRDKHVLRSPIHAYLRGCVQGFARRNCSAPEAARHPVVPCPGREKVIASSEDTPGGTTHDC